MRHRLLAAFLTALTCVVLLLILDLATARAAARYVAVGGNCGGATPCYSTIQSAIDAAQAGDEIRVATGVYKGVFDRNGSRQVVYIDKNLTILGGFQASDWSTPTGSPTEINAEGWGRVVVITGSIHVTLSDLHLTYGNAADLGGDLLLPPVQRDAGADLYIANANVKLAKLIVEEGTVPDGTGGGIYAFRSDLTLQEVEVRHNHAFEGGGISLYGSNTRIESSSISGNTTDLIGGAGGLYAQSVVNLDSVTWGHTLISATTFFDNRSPIGAGLWTHN